MATVEARDAYLTIEVVDLLKLNRKLFEAQKKDKAEIDNLKKEFG